MAPSNGRFLSRISTSAGHQYQYFSLPALAKELGLNLKTLPVSIRIVLESLLRHWDELTVTEEDIRTLATWQPNSERTREIPFTVARVLLQDFTGVPLGVDLAAMRSAMTRLGGNAEKIEPLVPVDLVIDHSVQVDYSSRQDALDLNLTLEFRRNRERYTFLKWCMEAFATFRVVPPGIGICHQVNLEFLAPGVVERNGVLLPDTLVGTDSHTTMINGLGVVGWGVGGIEAEAAMLGQPVYFLTPDVVGVHLSGALAEGATATDLVLRVTELLRKTKVVGKFVEFFGDGAASLPVPDRATISNMAPEYGATMGFFPVDERTCDYLTATGRTKEQVDRFRAYFQAQEMFGIPQRDECKYSQVVELDLSSVRPSIAGPKRPQDRIPLDEVKSTFTALLSTATKDGGFAITPEAVGTAAPLPARAEPLVVYKDLPPTLPLHKGSLHHGDVVIAAITSCTNTSNPSVMIAAGLVAKKAIERGMKVAPTVKMSLAPGSRVVSAYLEKAGLQQYLNELGFETVGYGCTTCIGNSGPLHPDIESTIQNNNLVVASVLSGNRNFEARVHQQVKANFLMSPPLVVAYALAGSTLKDLTKDPVGLDREGNEVYLRDLWPTLSEVAALLSSANDPALYQAMYHDTRNQSKDWNAIPVTKSTTYDWDKTSTYIQEPPYFENFSMQPAALTDIHDARALAIFGDSVTTDHISPAGAISVKSPAGKYLIEEKITESDFNSYGARRGNHEVMIRGTFANVRIKNLILGGREGGDTRHQPSGTEISIFDAATRYRAENVAQIIIAGQEYGTGSSRDWAAKGAALLGVRAVIAESFERIHRSNLIGMGVLPCQFTEGVSSKTLNLQGDETFTLTGISAGLAPKSMVQLSITRKDGTTQTIPVLARLDTPIEVEYLRQGGILPYVLRRLVSSGG